MMPKLFTMIKNKELSKHQVIKDVVSGIIVAIIALPLSIALAISSGVSPEKGLITAIFAGFMISILGGSKVQIGGPTAAFVAMIYAIVMQYGLDGLILAVIMAGIMLIIMGLLKFGTLIKYIPRTITVGFTAGIAVTLFSTQIKDLLQLDIKEVPAEFIPKWTSYITNIDTMNLSALLLGLSCIVIMIIWPKINNVIPGSMIALIVSVIAVKVLNLPVDTIGSRFTSISSSIPMPVIPTITVAKINQMFVPALTIATLGALESLLSAVVADDMIDDTHDSNMELIAQGAANIASGLFGGIPATGAIARTAANIKAGGRSPIACMVHSITLLLTMLFLMPLAKVIPMTTLAAILIVVAYNMSGWRAFKELLKAPKSDVVVLLVTFFCTVIFDLVVAIGVGMVLTMALFMKRITDTTEIRDLIDEDVFDENITSLLENSGGKINIYQVNGPMFFGVVRDFIKNAKKLKMSTEVVILDMRHTHAVDASAVDALEKLLAQCEKLNIKLYLTHLQEQPLKVLNRMGFIDKLGTSKVYETKTDAIENAYKYIQELTA